MATIPLERLSAKQGPAFIDRVHAMRQERLVREREEADKAAKEKLEAARKEYEERAMAARLRADKERRDKEYARLEALMEKEDEERLAELAREKKTLIKCAIGFAIALVLVTLIAVV
jgi:hypothetical protein